MTHTTTQAAPTVTLDVYAEEPADLRRRLRDRAMTPSVSLLPGGLVMTESEASHVYSLVATAGWTVVEAGEAVRLESPEGHVLEVREGRLSLTVAK